MKVPSAARGKRVKCPKCSAVLTVPAAETPPQPEPDDDLFGGLDDDGGLLDDLAAAEHSAEALARPNLSTGAPPPPPAFDPFEPAAPSGGGGAALAAGVASKLSGLGSATGRLALGCLLCGVAAAVGAAAWVMIAVVLDVQLGLLAWALGGLTGFAMAVGHRQASMLAGVIAAGMSFVAIMAAKIIVFAFVIYVVVTGDTDNDDLRRAFVTAQTANEILDERGVDRQSDREEQWEDAWAEAEARVERMDDDTFQRAWEQYREVGEADAFAEGEPNEMGATAGGAGGDVEYASAFSEPNEFDSEAAGGSALAAFAAVMFHPMDLIFFLLAIATAYKVGARGFGAG